MKNAKPIPTIGTATRDDCQNRAGYAAKSCRGSVYRTAVGK